MHDPHQGHGHREAHTHQDEPEKSQKTVPEIVKLRKMVEHWISHNEEHARSYRLWASRAREAGCEEPGEILEEIAAEIVGQNERFVKIARIIDSAGRRE